MPFITRRSFYTLTLLSVIAVLAVIGFVWSGIYNVGADDHHTKPMFALMQSLCQNSIHARSKSLQVPNLDDPQLNADARPVRRRPSRREHRIPEVGANEAALPRLDADGRYSHGRQSQRDRASHDGKPMVLLSNEMLYLKTTSAGWKITRIQWAS